MKKFWLVVVGLALASGVASADPFTYTGSMDTGLLASAKFETDGSGVLTITLSNISTADVMVPADVLTGVFFDLAGDPTLTPLTAYIASGSSFVNDTYAPIPSDGNVGGEWAYGTGLDAMPWHVGTQGISSTGLSLFGDYNFDDPAGTSNLSGPSAVNGLQYGLTSIGDNPATGNQAVTGGANTKESNQVPLVKYSVVFTLSGLDKDFDVKTGVSNVSFQYGTSLGEVGNPVPEPGTIALFGAALGAGWFFRRRRSA